ncbi:aldehyde dehydrogenase family protein, partial [Acinetobacter baumannii]|uniref:aldehyde dehydrogenase family protein n=1 Tax=Acinetobacter baumannii TaxID=470 RepID=UPI003F7C0F51
PTYPLMVYLLYFIKAGKQQAANVVSGGRRATEGEVAKGAYVLPTVFSDCTDHMAIGHEVIFGPVMSIFRYETEDV